MNKHLIRSVQPIKKALFIGIATGILCTALFLGGILETVELKTLDFRYKSLAHRMTPNHDIIIVTVDQNSIDYLKHKMGIMWQWPRDIYGYVINYLSGSGARAILLDFIFSDPDINRAEFEAGETDRILGASIGAAGNVTTSMYFSRGEQSPFAKKDDAMNSILSRFSLSVPGADNILIEEYSDAVPPISPILINSTSLGSSNIYPDSDGIVRKARLFHSYKGNIYPNSSLALVLSVSNDRTLSISKDRVLMLNGRSIPLNERGEIYINWYGPGGPKAGSSTYEGNTYNYYPFSDILLSALRVQDGLEPIVQPESFTNKIVLLGTNASMLFDLKPTPFSEEGVAYPGVEIVATLINNLLDGTSMSRARRGSTMLLIFCFALATALAGSLIKSASRNLFVTALIMGMVYAISAAAFYRNIFLDIVPVEAGVLLSFIGVTLANYLTEGREKRWLKKAFTQYMSPVIIQEIIDNPDKLKLGGEKRDITILFSDIRGFTSMSEKLEPEQLTHILNEYFTPMTGIIFQNNGTLDKYIGDAIMAFFGAPLPMDDHPVHACTAALEMINVLEKVKDRWKSEEMPVFVQRMNIGIGINSGPVSVGNMGSESRFDYTVIGDNVNLSSRLEGINKVYGTNIIVSHNTYERTHDLFIYRELDNIKVVGKDIPIRVYELVRKRDGSEEEEILIARLKRFEDGLGLYRQRKWDDAFSIFSNLYKIHNDQVAETFINRCLGLKEIQLPDDWDGVYERRAK